MPAAATRPPSYGTTPAELEELEWLWRAPAASPRAGRAVVQGLARVAFGGPVLAAAWIAVLAVALAGTPAAQNVTPPLWVDVVLFGFFIALAGAAVAARRAPLWGFVGSTVAGALGTVLGVACRATEHHTGGWWIYETASFAALAALSLVGLARNIKTST
jgi:hypothetical protein